MDYRPRREMLSTWIFLVLCSLFSAVFAGELSQRHNVIECTIYDMDGKPIRHFESGWCVFLKDGSLALGTMQSLKFYNPDMTVRWAKKAKLHHQLNLSLDQKRLLVMDSSYHRLQGKTLRFDRLSVNELNGKEVATFDFFEHRTELEKLASAFWTRKPYFIEPALRHEPKVQYEFAHANSFYEIPENDAAQANPAFRAGNYLVNINELGIIVVLDSQLKKILWSTQQASPGKEIRDHHDVQMLKNGRFLIYDNFSYLAKNLDHPFSTIDEFNPVTGERKALYRADPPESFYSLFSGGAQILENGHLLFSDRTRGKAFEVDQNGKTVWSMTNPELDPKTGRPSGFQQIKRYDLTEFLKNNQGI